MAIYWNYPAYNWSVSWPCCIRRQLEDCKKAKDDIKKAADTINTAYKTAVAAAAAGAGALTKEQWAAFALVYDASYKTIESTSFFGFFSNRGYQGLEDASATCEEALRSIAEVVNHLEQDNAALLKENGNLQAVASQQADEIDRLRSELHRIQTAYHR